MAIVNESLADVFEAANVEFVRTLHEPEHGGIEFSIRDPNGFVLRFHQQSR